MSKCCPGVLATAPAEIHKNSRSEALGHHGLEFTRRVYAKFFPESASKVVLLVLEGGEKWHKSGTSKLKK